MEALKAGVYVHVPFCVRKCGYCDFYSCPGRGETDFDAYADAVTAAIRRETPGIGADTVYFGGGTPSLLGADRLCRILDAVRETFSLESGAEITLEANPLDLEAPERLVRGGFNRLSLGVQSAHDGELALLGRRHTFAQAVRTAEEARAAGFEDLSLDLMYGLPGQTLQAWRESLDAVTALAPQHVSCYALHLSEGVPLRARADECPGDEAQLAMYRTAVERLGSAGLAQYEISNFAVPGFESRHNSKYWLGAEYYGFGPGAHSFIGGIRYAAESDLAAYLRAAHGGEPRQIVEAAPDSREEYVILRLRMTRGIDPADYERRFGEPFAPLAAVLEKYVPHGLTAFRDGRWQLTPEGMFVSNAILTELLEALDG